MKPDEQPNSAVLADGHETRSGSPKASGYYCLLVWRR
jgi:hypothetical protein